MKDFRLLNQVFAFVTVDSLMMSPNISIFFVNTRLFLKKFSSSLLKIKYKICYN